DELRFYQMRFKELSRRIEHPHAQLAAHDARSPPFGLPFGLSNGEAEAERAAIDRRVDQRFHPYWGSLLKEENEQSSFCAQVEEYACLYTSRVSDFLLYSPQ